MHWYACVQFFAACCDALRADEFEYMMIWFEPFESVPEECQKLYAVDIFNAPLRTEGVYHIMVSVT
jgi:hypothetical protein